MTRFPRAFQFALLFAASLPASAAGLNDTGQTLCYDAAGTPVTCTTASAANRDDGRYGRDAAATAGVLPKTGAGGVGFDFTKIANDGSAIADGVALGANPSDWACTRDNVTGLTWEVKTTSGLRSQAFLYTWYSTNAASNGGNAGALGADTCGGTLSAYSNQCNTANYVAAVNALTGANRLCGATDWRMPSIRELQSLVDFSVPASGAAPTIAATYFPNTQINWYWTGTNFAFFPAEAWVVSFYGGGSSAYGKTVSYYVRLVRGGQ